MSRRDDLILRTVGDEVVAYDKKTFEAHCLSPFAARVFEACDGSRSEKELALLVANAAASAYPGVSASDAVASALAELDRIGLLVSDGTTRRQALGRIAGLAAAVPLVASILAPTSAEATTCQASGAACTSSAQCCSGVCLGTGFCL